MEQPTAAQVQHVTGLIGHEHATELQARGINLQTVTALFLTFLRGMLGALLVQVPTTPPQVPTTGTAAKK